METIIIYTISNGVGNERYTHSEKEARKIAEQIPNAKITTEVEYYK